jgi:hypothetical protein
VGGLQGFEVAEELVMSALCVIDNDNTIAELTTTTSPTPTAKIRKE